MWRLRSFWLRLYFAFRPSLAEADLQREIAAHLRHLEDEHLASGARHSEADIAARRSFGGVELVKERHRDARSYRWITDGLRDVRHAIGSLKRTSASASIAVLSLGAGLGVLTGVYSTFDWLLNKPPDHVRDPDRLVLLGVSDPKLPSVTYGFSYDQYLVVASTPGLPRVATFNKQVSILRSGRETDQVVTSFIMGDYFDLLGVRPLHGRLLASSDDRPGDSIPVVLAYRSFVSRFGSDPAVIGRTVRLGGNVAEVVGVLPPRFEALFLDIAGPTDVWVPLTAMTPLGYRLTSTLRDQQAFQLLTRMDPGDVPAVLEQRLTAMLPDLPPARRTGTFIPTRVASTSFLDARVANRDVRHDFFTPLLIVCGLVLLAGCCNLSDFVSGRALARRGELALRAAIGASRLRLLWQLSAEVLVVGVLAIGVGAIFSVGTIFVLSAASPQYLQQPTSINAVSTTEALDVRVLAIVSVIGAACTLLFGVTPAIAAVRSAPQVYLRGRSIGRSTHPVRARARQVVIAAEVALAATLSIVAALYTLSFLHVARVDTGYPAAHRVLLARLNLTALDPPDRAVLFDRLRPALLETLVVVDATIGWNPPHFVGHNLLWTPGHEDAGQMVGISAGAPRFFGVQGIALLAGREFDGSVSDERSSIIINVPTARALWPDRDTLPVGEIVISRLGNNVPRTVIGIAADDRCDDLLGQNRRCAWLPFTHSEQLGYLRIRTRDAPMRFAPTLRDIVHGLHPDAAVAEEVGLDDYLGQVAADHRTAMLAASGLAAFAMVLAVVGIAAVFRALVLQRQRELALRLALGARPTLLARRVLTNASLIAVVGGFAGFAIAWRVSDLIAPQLHHVNAHDPRLALVAAGLVVIAVSAAGRAAFRAATVDPALPLRVESPR